ncbi:hypothetical protein MUGA111182_13285 [Mucilaginibacter galii]
MLTACRKDRTKPVTGNDCRSSCYILAGTIIDTPGKFGLAGVELELRSTYSGYTFHNPLNILAKTVTDNNGKYRFSVPSGSVDLNRNYLSVVLKKTTYFYRTPDEKLGLYDTKFKPDSAITVNAAMFRQATMDIKLEISRPFAPNTFSFYYDYGSKTAHGYNVNPEDAGKLYNVTTAGDMKTIIFWDIDKVRYKDSLTVPAGQKGTYTIKF